MADHPILFSPPMVRALLAGRKTQTRRIAKFVEEQANGLFHLRGAGGGAFNASAEDVVTDGPDYAPISVGDRLWVREMLCADSNDQGGEWISYVADGKQVWPLSRWPWRRTLIPSIHMPRWISRITLEVTDVRVQRLREISEEDAIAEGAYPAAVHGGRVESWLPAEGIRDRFYLTALAAYNALWDRTNGPGSWASNPWVAAYTFAPVLCNIDRMERNVHG